VSHTWDQRVTKKGPTLYTHYLSDDHMTRHNLHFWSERQGADVSSSDDTRRNDTRTFHRDVPAISWHQLIFFLDVVKEWNFHPDLILNHAPILKTLLTSSTSLSSSTNHLLTHIHTQLDQIIRPSLAFHWFCYAFLVSRLVVTLFFLPVSPACAYRCHCRTARFGIFVVHSIISHPLLYSRLKIWHIVEWNS